MSFFNKSGRRKSIMRIEDHSKIPHWYNREDKDQVRSIFCTLERLCHLEVSPQSRMIREFVGSVFRRGVISFEPFVDFSIITVCKDRTQGKEQDDFEHTQHMALVTWDSEDGIPCEVEYITTEPTVRFSFGRTITSHPPVHPGSFHSATGGERSSVAEAPTFAVSAGGGLLPPNGASNNWGGSATSEGSASPTSHSGHTTPEIGMRMLTKWYPELLCMPKYPRAKERDLDYPTKEVISSARNERRFLLRARESTMPSLITYTYAAGMPSRSPSAGSGGMSNTSNTSIGSIATDGTAEYEEEFVFFPTDCIPGNGCTSTSERSPWGPRPTADEEDDGNDSASDSSSSDGDGGGPPNVVEWEEDDEWQ